MKMVRFLSPRCLNLPLLAGIVLCVTATGDADAQNIVTNVPISQVEASQYTIGLNGVAWASSSTLSNFFKQYITGWKNGKVDTSKPWNYYGPGADGLLNYESNNAPPAILGPDGLEHLQDNHHRLSGIYLLTTIFTNGYSAEVTVTNAQGVVFTTNIGAAPTNVYLTQIAAWTNMTMSDFWGTLMAGNSKGVTNFAPVVTNGASGFWNSTNQPTYLWTSSNGVTMNPNITPPPMLTNLVNSDDTLRDVAAQVNYPGDYGASNYGYQVRDEASSNTVKSGKGDGHVLYYQEFWWANYLRPLVYLIPTNPVVTNATSIPTSGMDSNAPYQFTNYGDSNSANLISFCADFLCHLPAATYLPGYYLIPLSNTPLFPEVAFESIPFTNNSTLWIGNGGTNISVSNDLIISSRSLTRVEGSLNLLGDLYVGESDSGNRLLITNGGSLTNGLASYGAVIGFNSNASANSALVSGPGSLWNATDSYLEVGFGGSGNSLVISNGGKAQNWIGVVGDQQSAIGNSATVTGTGSLWSNANILLIGASGSGNSLRISEGGLVSSLDGTIGVNARANRNSAVISGSGSLWSNGNSFTVGYGGSSNSLHISTGGGVISSNGYIGRETGSIGNSVTLTGAGSFWSNSGTLFIGDGGTGTGGGSGTLTILNGATVQAAALNLVQGTLNIGSTNSLGTAAISLGGGSGATFNLLTNLTITSLNWSANSVISLTPGSRHMTVTGLLENSGGGVFSFNNHILDNATLVLISFGTQSGFTPGSFSVLGGIQGYTFTVGPDSVTATIAKNAHLVISGPATVGMGTLSVGSLTMTPTGGLILPISGSTSGMISVAGNAILGGTLTVMPTPGSTLTIGEKIVFLSAANITGSFSSVDVPNGFRGRVKIFGDPMLEVILAPASYTQMAQNRNQSNVASALNSFIPATSGDRLVVSTTLDSLTAGQYNQAFNAIMPSFYQQIATIAFNQANAQNMELSQRLWGLRVAEGGGFSMSGLADNYAMLQEGQGDGGKGVLDSKKDILRPGLDNRWGMFVDGNGIFAQANSANMLPGYNSESGGVTAGLTYKWNKNVASGIYCGYQGTYTKSGANGSGLGTGSSLTDNAVRFGVFGTYGQENGKGFYANALAGGAYHNLQATRVIQFPGLNRTASSAPGAGELDTMLATGYDVQKGNFTFGPTASLQYTYLGVNSLNETGAQSLNFNSSGWNSSSMLSSVGAHAAYNWVAHHGSGGDIVIVPQISLNWQHEFMQNPYAINGNLGGTSPSFSNWSAAPIRDFLYTGVGFTVEFAKNWYTSFFYNAAAGNNDLTSQSIFWSAGLKF